MTEIVKKEINEGNSEKGAPLFSLSGFSESIAFNKE